MSGTQTSEEITVNKKHFNLFMDKHPVVRFGFTEVTENMLYMEEDAEDMVYLWFRTELEAADLLSREDRWTMQLFIDGQYILTDQFSVSRFTTYSRSSLQHNYI